MGKRINTAKWSDKEERWRINVQKDGQRRSFYSSTPGRNGQREANEKADAWLDDNIVDANLRLNVLWKDYAEYQRQTTSAANADKIDSTGKNWILPAIGGLKASALYEQHIQNILARAAAKGLSRKTIRGIKATCTSFIKYCRKRKALTLFPEDLTIPKHVRYKGKKILQPDELRKMLSRNFTYENGKPAFDYTIYAYRFQVSTGLRPGELLGLEWEDIYDGIVHIRRSLNSSGEITTGKNENAIRQFALNCRQQNILEQQKALEIGTKRVFGNIKPKTYYDRWKRYCRFNEITPISPYEMRHTFVSIAKILPEGMIKPLVGHSENMDTYGTYAKEIKGEMKFVADRVEDCFDSILTVKK